MARNDPGLSSVKFAGAIFTDRADFRGAIFGDDPSFHNCVFGAITDFDCATLGLRANFSHARFGSVSFAGASFGGGTSFYNVTFARSAIFLGMSRSDWVSHLEERLSNGHLNLKDALEPKLHERHARSWGENQICPDRLGSIAFTGAHSGESDFSGRTFTQIVLFSNATFHRVPSFRAISQAGQIDFAGASISFVSPYRPRWTFRSAVAVQLRALRKLAEETKTHDLERDLYFEEKEAERGIYLYQHLKGRPKPLRVISHLIWIIVMYLYWVVADYGRSFMRPIVWLLFSEGYFRWRFEALFEPILQTAILAGTVSPEQILKYRQAVQMMVFANAVPGVGPPTVDAAVKRFLFCPGAPSSTCLPVPPQHFQFLVLEQNFISIVLIFL